MPADLTGVRAKLGWAAHHFELLHTEIDKWFEPPDQPSVGAETDLANERYAVIYYEPRHKPIEWSLIAGDFLNNLRSTLDHLVSQVVVSEGGTPGQHHAFPIAVTEGSWLTNVANRSTKRGPGPLDGISQHSPAWKLLADAQPYVGRDKAAAQATPIATLARLNNTDKHRELNLSTVTMSDKFSFSVSADYRPLGGYLPPTGSAIEPNKQFGWLAIELVGVDEAEIKINLSIQVAFDGVPVADFRVMFEEVKALVVAFENLLGV